MADMQTAVGQAMRARRRAREMTLAQVAGAAGIDVSQLSKVERGTRQTSVDGYDRIARALGWSSPAMWMSAAKIAKGRGTR